MKSYATLVVAVIFMFIVTTETKTQAEDIGSQATGTNNIFQYLVDVSATPVSAGGLVGLTGSAITDVQSAQDLVFAVNPLSSGSSKSGFGIAVTPARTNILPMSGEAYKKNKWMRLLGATTLSYAENVTSISDASYRESAVSVDAAFYPDEDDDPIIKASKLFSKGTNECFERKVKDADLAEFIATHDMEQDSNKLEVEKMRQTAVDVWTKCLKSEANKAKWNATKLSLSFGTGWIKPDAAAGSNQSLGRTVTIGGIFKLGNDSAAYISLRNTSHEVDLTTLSGTPTFKSSSLAAIRITQGSENGGDLRWLAEYSDARASSVTVSNDVFMYAAGIDMKVFAGVWLQFRVGRNHTADGTTTQTTSLLSLNWAPSSTLFSNK